jgi:cysteine-S-conjugate beta-lyase
MSDARRFHPETRLSHGGRNRERSAGAVNVPPYRASTVLFGSLAEYRNLDGDPLSFRYARQGTPTSRELESAYAELEGASGAVATCSGLSAATVALSAFLGHGDHLLITAGSYEPTLVYAREVLAKRIGVEVETFDPREGARLAERVRETTRAVMLESPSSLTFELHDLPAISVAVREAAAPQGAEPALLLDNTWATGLFHRPLELGADVVVQAATKYITGHSDAMLGLIACKAQALPAVRRMARLQGVHASPDDCWLGLRGLRTLSVRLQRHQASALELARWLQQRPEVIEVLHPGLPEHPDHAIWLRDFSGASGLFGFRLDPKYDEAALARMLDGMQLFGMGYSFGAFESLLIPAELPDYRAATQPPGVLMRLHAGLEHVEDLRADLEAGFARLNAA